MSRIMDYDYEMHMIRYTGLTLVTAVTNEFENWKFDITTRDDRLSRKIPN